jgi:hypothetical protein
MAKGGMVARAPILGKIWGRSAVGVGGVETKVSQPKGSEIISLHFGMYS